jgi:hypothetical protein
MKVTANVDWEDVFSKGAEMPTPKPPPLGAVSENGIG